MTATILYLVPPVTSTPCPSWCGRQDEGPHADHQRALYRGDDSSAYLVEDEDGQRVELGLAGDVVAAPGGACVWVPVTGAGTLAATLREVSVALAAFDLATVPV